MQDESAFMIALFLFLFWFFFNAILHFLHGSFIYLLLSFYFNDHYQFIWYFEHIVLHHLCWFRVRKFWPINQDTNILTIILNDNKINKYQFEYSLVDETSITIFFRRKYVFCYATWAKFERSFSTREQIQPRIDFTQVSHVFIILALLAISSTTPFFFLKIFTNWTLEKKNSWVQMTSASITIWKVDGSIPTSTIIELKKINK